MDACLLALPEGVTEEEEVFWRVVLTCCGEELPAWKEREDNYFLVSIV